MEKVNEQMTYFVGDKITFVSAWDGEKTTEDIEAIEFHWRMYCGELIKYIKYVTDKGSVIIDCLRDYHGAYAFTSNEKATYINKE